MKEFISNNWRAKLLCLVLASAIWYLVRKNIMRAPFFLPEWTHHSAVYTKQ